MAFFRMAHLSHIMLKSAMMCLKGMVKDLEYMGFGGGGPMEF